MTEGIAARFFTLDGAEYPEGVEVSFPDNQFSDLEECGLVVRRKVAPKPKVKA